MSSFPACWGVDLEPRPNVVRSTSRSPLYTNSQAGMWNTGGVFTLPAHTERDINPPNLSSSLCLGGQTWPSIHFLVLFLRTMEHFPEVCGGAYIFCIRSRVCCLFCPYPNAQKVCRAQRVESGPTGLWATFDLPKVPDKGQKKLSHGSWANFEAYWKRIMLLDFEMGAWGSEEASD